MNIEVICFFSIHKYSSLSYHYEAKVIHIFELSQKKSFLCPLFEFISKNVKHFHLRSKLILLGVIKQKLKMYQTELPP